MKSIRMLIFPLLLLIVNPLYCQQTLPEVDLFNLDGNRVRSSEITANGNPLLMIFWKTNDNSCCTQLNNIDELYREELKDMGIKVMAICVDCSGSIGHIKPVVNGRDYDFEVLIDKNGVFKRSMNVSGVPYSILFDGNMKIHCRYAGYCQGIEYLLFDKIGDCIADLQQ